MRIPFEKHRPRLDLLIFRNSNDRSVRHLELIELALFLESDRMGYLLDSMNAKTVDAQRDIVKNERRQSYENRPYGSAELLLGELLYPEGHPYHWPVIGYMPDLTAASYDDVVAFFKTFYAPANASLVVAGDLDPSCFYRVNRTDIREGVVHGFGVHMGYAGHDMHGLPVGPDGRIYWSIGDKGVSVTSREGRRYQLPNEGATLRMEPDGSGFEVYTKGNRNVQEPAFNEVGDLIGVDNDADQPGERERFVYLVEGSDSGWRCNYQYMGTRSPWMREGLWKPHFPGQEGFKTLSPWLNQSNLTIISTRTGVQPPSWLGTSWLVFLKRWSFVGGR